MLRRKIRHVFRRGRPTNFRLGTWMEYDDPHHVTNVRNDVRSRRSRSSRQSDACLPITRKRKVSKTPKSAGRLSVPRLTFRTSCPRSKVKVTRPLNSMTENQPHLRNGKAWKLQNLVYGWSTMTRITNRGHHAHIMEHEDLHH